MNQEQTLLRVDQLSIDYARSRSAPIRALDRLSFGVRRGERLGILGESGCGKSSLALALLRLLPANGRQSGEVLFQGHRLDQLDERRMRGLRGAHIALIFQDPATSLHPMKRVGTQILDVMRAHGRGSGRQAREEMLRHLRELDLEEAELISGSFPHQLSGGQRQRVAIALVLVCRPALVIADEPITALDVDLRSRVLELFEQWTRKASTSWIFISHDPRVLERMADRVLVLHAGRLVEEGTVEQVLKHPAHPYTRGLLASLPPLPPPEVAACERPPLPTLTGETVIAHGEATHCRFAPRCPLRVERCVQQLPPLVSIASQQLGPEPLGPVQLDSGQRIECWRPGGIDV